MRGRTVAMLLDAGVANEVALHQEAVQDGKGQKLSGDVAWVVDLARTVRSVGYQVQAVAYGPDVLGMATELVKTSPAVVLNLTEHLAGERRMDAHAAALLELLGIPFTGARLEGLVLCRDKALSKHVVRAAGIKVPAFITVAVGDRPVNGSLPLPAIVKPQLGDGSDGVSMRSIVKSEKAMLERVQMLHRTTRQSVICEEFIAGREITVAVIGNYPTLHAFPPRENRFPGHRVETGTNIMTYTSKGNPPFQKQHGITFPRAKIAPSQVQKVQEAAIHIYGLLGIAGFGKIDFRVNNNGECYFLEANPNHDLSRRGFGMYARWDGISYKALVSRILELAITASRA